MPTMDTMDIILDTLTTDTTDTHMLMLDTTTARGPLMLTLRLMLDTFMVTMDTDTTSCLCPPRILWTSSWIR